MKDQQRIFAADGEVIQIFQQMAGYSLGQADMVRRAMSKKKFDVLEAERQNFVFGNESEGFRGCAANGVPEQRAEEIFSMMETFASLSPQTSQR